MAIYEYQDTFVINSVDPDDLDKAEQDAITDLENQGVTNVFYKEKMRECLVYVALGGLQIEADGMQEKIDYYRKEYARYSKMDLTDGTDEPIYSVEIGRG